MHTSLGLETLWYTVYAAALWLVVAVIVATHGMGLVRQPKEAKRQGEKVG